MPQNFARSRTVLAAGNLFYVYTKVSGRKNHSVWQRTMTVFTLHSIVNCYCWKHNSSVEKMSLHMKQNCWISICDTLIVTWVLNPSDRRSRSVKWKKINIDVYQKKVLNLAKNASLCLNNIIPSFSFLHVKQKAPSITRITRFLIACSIRIH